MKPFSFITKLFKGKADSQLAKANEIEMRRTQQESLDKLNGAFNHLITKLENINDSLTKHLSQQDELLRRFEVIPQITKHQTELIEKTLDQIQEQSRATKKFVDVVARIPDEAVRQTRELELIKNEVTQSADFEKTLCQEIVKLNVRFKFMTTMMYCFCGVIVIIAVAAVIIFLTAK